MTEPSSWSVIIIIIIIIIITIIIITMIARIATRALGQAQDRTCVPKGAGHKTNTYLPTLLGCPWELFREHFSPLFLYPNFTPLRGLF